MTNAANAITKGFSQESRREGGMRARTMVRRPSNQSSPRRSSPFLLAFCSLVGFRPLETFFGLDPLSCLRVFVAFVVIVGSSVG
jgi:hypothetical protein